MIKVLGIKIIDRIKEAGLTQKVLSKNADVITTRLGFHEVTYEVCSREACIILHLADEPSKYKELKNDLKQIGGIAVSEVEFDRDPHTAFSDNIGKAPVLGVLVEQDSKTVMKVQAILTSYGCCISSRLGVNELFYGKKAGLIILTLTGDTEQRRLLEEALRSLDNVYVRSLMF